MISISASIVLGLVLDIKILFFSPLVYLLSYWRKETFLIAFLFYSLFLGYEFKLEDLYKLEIHAISILIATILLLEEGINVRKMRSLDYLLSLSMLFGILFVEATLIILLLSFFHRFYQDIPKKGILALLLPIFLIFIFIFLEPQIDFLGSTATQAMVISSITALVCLIFIRRILD